MNRMGRDTVSVVMDKLPILNKVIRWFKGDDMNIDNHLFKLHYQASTLIIVIGFIVISEKNYLDLPQKSILCHSDKTLSEYAKSYCWIHGTSYVRKALQGKATGCFVDQTKIESEEDAPVTAYYLWLPYLLTICFILARLPRSAWKRFFENRLIHHILKGKSENVPVQRGNQGGQVNTAKKAAEIAENFLDYRPKYAKYHFWFGFCEVCNIFCVGLSMFFCNWLLNYQFALYGLKVLEYLGTIKRVNQLGQYVTHDPMCELFPTEVACTLRYGATTGALDRSNFLCILGNNLFNQKYFFVLWLWWMFLLIVSVLGMVYRIARISFPSLSRYLLSRKIHGKSLVELDQLRLNSGDAFVLEMVMENLRGTPNLAIEVVESIADKINRKKEEMNPHNWRRMQEIEAGLEDGLKGETFNALNASGNFIANGGGPPGGGGDNGGGARYDGSGGQGGNGTPRPQKKNPNKNRHSSGKMNPAAAAAAVAAVAALNQATAPPAQDKSNSNSASTVRMTPSDDGMNVNYPDLDEDDEEIEMLKKVGFGADV